MGHHRVYLTELASHIKMKKIRRGAMPIWASLRRMVGWNDPAFCKATRPNRVAGSFQPTRAIERRARCNYLQSNGNRGAIRR
jgi:hypothetical protein